jgi:hypothetical protein
MVEWRTWERSRHQRTTTATYSTSLFRHIQRMASASVLARCVHDVNAERDAKCFPRWDQYMEMLFCRFAQATILREIADGLQVMCGKLNILVCAEYPHTQGRS